MYIPSHINPIIKLTESCNYNCYFCRYANHRQKDSGIPVDLASTMIEQCANYNIEKHFPHMNIIFHGGEPLLYGVPRFSEIVENIHKVEKKGIDISLSIQTNASLLDEKWICFFADNHFSVGISLDGPSGMNGHIGKSDEQSQQDAIKAYHLLTNRGIDCGFLCVITNNHISDPERFLNFFIDNKVETIGLCYCYNELDDENVNPYQLGVFLKSLYDLYYSTKKRIRIREFDMATRFILHRPKHECAMSCRSSCGTFLTITPNGNVEFCDDYNLERRGSLGNILETSLSEMIIGEKYQTKRREATEILNRYCESCDVYSICRSGCMRNDNSKGNYFCETYKLIYPYIKERVLLHTQHN